MGRPGREPPAGILVCTQFLSLTVRNRGTVFKLDIQDIFCKNTLWPFISDKICTPRRTPLPHAARQAGFPPPAPSGASSSVPAPPARSRRRACLIGRSDSANDLLHAALVLEENVERMVGPTGYASFAFLAGASPRRACHARLPPPRPDEVEADLRGEVQERLRVHVRVRAQVARSVVVDRGLRRRALCLPTATAIPPREALRK